MKKIQDLSKEELLEEYTYLEALVQTLVNQNAQLNLQLAHFETQAQINNRKKEGEKI